MRLNFYYRSLAVSIILLMTSAVVQAQDAANPWHLTAKENGKEVAFYNVEHITDVKATAQTVTVVLDNGKQFSHPIATIFSFDPRKSGTGTANEMITVPQWNVFYADGRLNFNEQVSNVAVYSIMGILVSRSAGTYTSVPVNLAPGVYVVQAGDKSAKLMVADGSFGRSSTAVQPVQSVVEPQAIANVPSPVSLRAGTVKIYWNITTSNTAFPVEIPEVEKFYFTPDNSIVFTLKNGTTVQLDGYKNVTFTAEPVQTGTLKWNMDLTLKFGGAAYGVNGTLPSEQAFRTKYVSVFSDKEIIINDILGKVERKYPIAFIPDYDARISMFSSIALGGILKPAFSYKKDIGNGIYAISFMSISDGSLIGGAVIQNWPNDTNIIKTTFKINADGSITAVYEGGDYTFK